MDFIEKAEPEMYSSVWQMPRFVLSISICYYDGYLITPSGVAVDTADDPFRSALVSDGKTYPLHKCRDTERTNVNGVGGKTKNSFQKL